MIPKIIHYCWLSGDPYPPLIEKCITSWYKYLPDYEFVLWNTKRIDINSSFWLKECVEHKKYAFAADYIRFYALYHYGGIYLDADVEVLKSYNPLLSNEYIIGREVSGDIEAATIGAEKGAKWVYDCLSHYNDRHFVKKDGSLDMRPVPILISDVIQSYPDMHIYSYQYFSPKDYNSERLDVSLDTYSIHHFDGKWVPNTFYVRMKRMVHNFIKRFFGLKLHNKFVRVIRYIKYR